MKSKNEVKKADEVYVLSSYTMYGAHRKGPTIYSLNDLVDRNPPVTSRSWRTGSRENQSRSESASVISFTIRGSPGL